jgi:hypothetical protein
MLSAPHANVTSFKRRTIRTLSSLRWSPSPPLRTLTPALPLLSTNSALSLLHLSSVGVGLSSEKVGVRLSLHATGDSFARVYRTPQRLAPLILHHVVALAFATIPSDAQSLGITMPDAPSGYHWPMASENTAPPSPRVEHQRTASSFRSYAWFLAPPPPASPPSISPWTSPSRSGTRLLAAGPLTPPPRAPTALR